MLTPAASRCSWRHYSASAQGVLLFIFKKYTEVKHVNTEEKCSLPICSGPVVHPILSGQVKMLLSARQNKQNTFSAWYGHWWKFRLFSSPPSKNHLHRQNVKHFDVVWCSFGRYFSNILFEIPEISSFQRNQEHGTEGGIRMFIRNCVDYVERDSRSQSQSKLFKNCFNFFSFWFVFI